jgi:hypothetical protein
MEFQKFKEAVEKNPADLGLRARFAKFCIQHCLNRENPKLNEVEAVNQFENIDHSELLDLEVYYLMGKYYLGQCDEKAAEVFLKGIRKYNEFATRHFALRNEHVETAFNIALSLLKLDHSNAGPDLEKFFKIVRNTYLKHYLTEKVGFGMESAQAS